MKLFSLMFEQQKQEPTSSVFKSYRGWKYFLTEYQFQLFEPIAMELAHTTIFTLSNCKIVKALSFHTVALLLVLSLGCHLSYGL